MTLASIAARLGIEMLAIGAHEDWAAAVESGTELEVADDCESAVRAERQQAARALVRRRGVSSMRGDAPGSIFKQRFYKLMTAEDQ